MELFLNLCWLALLLPAYWLWQRRHPSDQSVRRSAVIVGALGCVLMLLFPVVSASDDLHAPAQAIEESKNSFRQGSPPACAAHSAHTLPFVSPSLAGAQVGFSQIGVLQSISVHSSAALFASAAAGRSPPVAL
ncbi:MAG TPA: hypothetical protein VF786_10055 [Terriglobales bacterium]